MESVMRQSCSPTQKTHSEKGRPCACSYARIQVFLMTRFCPITPTAGKLRSCLSSIKCTWALNLLWFVPPKRLTVCWLSSPSPISFSSPCLPFMPPFLLAFISSETFYALFEFAHLEYIFRNCELFCLSLFCQIVKENLFVISAKISQRHLQLFQIAV